MQIDTNRKRIDRKTLHAPCIIGFAIFLYSRTFYDQSKYRLTSRCSNLRAGNGYPGRRRIRMQIQVKSVPREAAGLHASID